MSIYIFTGPTLSADDARKVLDAVVLPPVSQGDVYRIAATQRPVAIGIIDGYFERIPAVWHKEILWAMSEGVHVFGASSMGALRAAELADFGMEGVGWIFEQFRDGTLEDDDEVTVVHGPADDGYRGGSEAMVNIRRTLDAAAQGAVVSGAVAASLVRIAKEMPYFERSYPALLARAAARGVSEGDLAALRAWLPRGKVNQKRDDAIAMLESMRRLVGPNIAPKRVDYHFEWTEWWDRAKASASQARATASASPRAGDAVSFDALLEEIRLSPDLYGRMFEGAMLRILARVEASRSGQTASVETIARTAEAFRRERGLFEASELAAWRGQHHLSRQGFNQLMASESTLRGVARAMVEPVEAHMADELRVRGEYLAVVERATRKAAALERRGLQSPALDDLGITEHELFSWYFHERCGMSRVDVDKHMHSVGFHDGESFRRAVLREYAFSRLASGEAHGAPAQADAHG